VCIGLLAPGLTLGVRAQLGALTDQEFQSKSLDLSEAPGQFGTDNLVSNESSFLHVTSQVRENVAAGRAYIGVGPGQNFTYIALARPEVAYVLDIRRDNLLHHLLYKARFLQSDNRWQYMSRLFGKPLPAHFDFDLGIGSPELVRTFQRLPSSQEFFDRNFEKTWDLLSNRFPGLVQERDRWILLRIARKFFEEGLDVHYEIPARPMLGFFPSFGQLMLETDLDGNYGHYLSREEDFRFLKKLHEKNRIIPVVGNFSGAKALKAIAGDLRRENLLVGLFYTSNVEFYLFRYRSYRRFLSNVRTLPVDENSLLIRSYFNNWYGTWRTHPDAVRDYFSTSLIQRVSRLTEMDDVLPYRSYWDLVTRDYMLPEMTRAPAF